MNDLEKQVWEILKKIQDPEIGCSIVDLGLIYKIEIEKETVDIDMTLTTPGCPLAQMISQDIEKEVGKIKGIKGVKINLVFDPPWTPKMMTPKLRKQMGV